jgi:hypothetical protein
MADALFIVARLAALATDLSGVVSDDAPAFGPIRASSS